MDTPAATRCALTVWTRIAYRDTSGNLWAGILGVIWTQETTSAVDEYLMTTSYLVVRVGSTIAVKPGLTDTWSTVTTSGADIQAGGHRIAYRDTSNNIWAGTPGVSWSQQTGSVDQYFVS